ncbi:DUF4082 domain-containing protein [Actinosynnema sp. NPDC020468]|uniref:DUF4082 domain-containing protein n=1 Tax=Actinosynnema sp. NPDC020468 TaxID=3154488 RepID=UPI0033D764FE
MEVPHLHGKGDTMPSSRTTRPRPGRWWARLLAIAVVAATAPALTAGPALADPSVAFTDVPPTSTVGKDYTFAGTVSDVDGVAGVEVSTDGGATWSPATWRAGGTSWSHTYTPNASGTARLLVRTVDGERHQTSQASATPAVSPRACPCGLWGDDDTPSVPDASDGSALELGVKWRSSSAGYVRGVRFYKGPGNSGVHTGALWSAAGQKLATGTFRGESGIGWQTLVFPKPVAVADNTTYVVSYLSPTGHFSVDAGYFTRAPRYLEPLTGLQTGTDGPNGVFRGGAGFPDQSAGDANYWVDVVWSTEEGQDTRPPDLLGLGPVDGAVSVPLNAVVSAAYDEVLAQSVEFGLTGPAGAVEGATAVTGNGMTAQFVPNAELTAGTRYTASVRVKDAAGNYTTVRSWPFTTGSPRPAACPCTIWDDFSAPTLAAADDGTAVELGVKVRFDGRGEVTALRFFKGEGNTGTHTGTLWSATGQKLATGTFTGESGAGWQTLTFDRPVPVEANTTYVASYFAPNGHYAATQQYFSAGAASYGQLHALAEGADGPNGLFHAGAGFPTSSHLSTNYWVDVVYRTGLNGDTAKPTLVSRDPAPDSGGAAVGGPITLGFDEPIDPGSLRLTLTDLGGGVITGTRTFSVDGRTARWTPDAPLKPNTNYYASVLAADVNGNALAQAENWAFHTAYAPDTACPCSLFSTAYRPRVPSANDGGAYELGFRFDSTKGGFVTAVKFYKGEGNTGTHTGSVWSDDGLRLATGTFTGETDTGWQTLVLEHPVPIQKHLSYVVSYTAPNGHYAIDHGYFDRSAVASSGPLYARNAVNRGNGLFQPGGGFPTKFQGNNYWVDVDFTVADDERPPEVVSVSPHDYAGNAPESVVTATFDEPVSDLSTVISVTDGTGNRIKGTTDRNDGGATLVWRPVARLANQAHYEVEITASDLAGNIGRLRYWWFDTGVGACPCSLFSEAAGLSSSDSEIGRPVEVGVRFDTRSRGKITALKFLKSARDTGTHTGTLWSDGGTVLATGTYTHETASGWQTLVLDQPVTIEGNTSYVATYSSSSGVFRFAPVYVKSGRAAQFPLNAWPLYAPGTGSSSTYWLNGLSRFGSTGFPDTATGVNAWADVVFVPA